jgi:hypothetical protein
MKKCPKNEVAGSFFAVSSAKTSDLCLLEEKTVQKSPVSSILGQNVEDSRQESHFRFPLANQLVLLVLLYFFSGLGRFFLCYRAVFH